MASLEQCYHCAAHSTTRAKIATGFHIAVCSASCLEATNPHWAAAIIGIENDEDAAATAAAAAASAAAATTAASTDRRDAKRTAAEAAEASGSGDDETERRGEKRDRDDDDDDDDDDDEATGGGAAPAAKRARADGSAGAEVLARLYKKTKLIKVADVCKLNAGLRARICDGIDSRHAAESSVEWQPTPAVRKFWALWAEERSKELGKPKDEATGFYGFVEKEFVRAARDGRLDAVQFALLVGVRPTARQNFALLLAATNGHANVVTALLRYSDALGNGAGYSVDKKNFALRLAVAYYRFDVVQALLAAGVSPARNSSSVLAIIAQLRSVNMGGYIAGGDENMSVAEVIHVQTPVPNYEPEEKRVRMARILIDAGADPTTIQGLAVKQAVVNDLGRLLQVYIDAGGKVTDRGLLPEAARSDAKRAIRVLIVNGADPDKMDLRSTTRYADLIERSLEERRATLNVKSALARADKAQARYLAVLAASRDVDGPRASADDVQRAKSALEEAQESVLAAKQALGELVEAQDQIEAEEKRARERIFGGGGSGTGADDDDDDDDDSSSSISAQ